ncbi:MAG: glycoside hydrolase family 3 N-terminal domain-containing protein [Microthrixaceae bacterium]
MIQLRRVPLAAAAHRLRSHSGALGLFLVLFAASCAGTTSADVTAAGTEVPPTDADAAAPTTVAAGSATTVDLNDLRKCIDSLSVEEKAGQTLWVMTSTPANVAEAAAAGRIGGVGALEDQGSDIADQIKQVTSGARVKMAVSSDEEGGLVQRLDKVLQPLPSARDTTETLSTDQTAEMWSTYATDMAALGFNTNFAPVLDVGFGPALTSRSYGLDPAVVSDFAIAAMTGMNEGGITPIAKHFPGIGYADSDPHGQLVTVGGLDQLKQREFLPFQAAIEAGVPAIMTTHAVIPDVTGQEPVSMSPEGVALLRDDLDFKGLIVTDSLSMGAIADSRSQPEAAVQALVAGNDVALIAGAQNIEASHAALVAAVADGTISEDQLTESAQRVLSFKGITGPCPAGGSEPATPTTPVPASTQAPGTTVAQRDPLGGGQAG